MEHQEAFKEKLRAEQPRELLLAPTCGPWSQMQNLAAQSDEQQRELILYDMAPPSISASEVLL